MKRPVIITMLIAGLVTVAPQYGITQQTSKPDTEETLRKGQIVAGNIQTAITGHILDDPSFRQNKQLPEDPRITRES